MHTNLASYLSQQINARSLDKFFEVEKSLIFNKYLSSKVKTISLTKERVQ